MRKARRVGEVKFRPVQAAGLIDIVVLYKRDAPLTTRTGRGRGRNSTRLPPRAFAPTCGGALTKKPEHLDMPPDEGGMVVHVHIGATTDLGETILKNGSARSCECHSDTISLCKCSQVK